MNPAGRVAVVTGASSGIGRATALELARTGAKVVLAARRIDRLETLAAECRALGTEALAVETDVSDQSSCVRLIERASSLGDVDILINNAGFAIFDRIAQARPEDVRAMMETNYLGTVWCTQAALPGMLERRRGHVVAVGSITGIMGFAGMAGYGATKFALTGFMEALRDEVIDHGIGTSLVCPASTDTEFFVTGDRAKIPAASRLLATIPPERIARMIVSVIRSGRPRVVIPASASLYMRFKELAPRTAHYLMRRTSKLLERRKVE